MTCKKYHPPLHKDIPQHLCVVIYLNVFPLSDIRRIEACPRYLLLENSPDIASVL